MESEFMAHDLSIIENGVEIGNATRIWQFAHIREDVKIGSDCVIGNSAYIGPGVEIGSRVKIQNGCLIYEPAVISSDVFLGPRVILTNDKKPRSVSPEGVLKIASDWNKQGVVIGKGASIGAGSILIAPVKIGPWTMVGAGSVVTKDTKPYSLIYGNPARQVGWVSKSGDKLAPTSVGDEFYCKVTDSYFELVDGIMVNKSE